MKIQRPWLENSPFEFAGSDGDGRVAKPTNPTIEHLWRYLLSPSSDAKPWNGTIKWPPDVFALCAAALRRSGAYAAAGTNASRESRRQMMHSGKAWAEYISNDPRKPYSKYDLNCLLDHWNDLCRKLDKEIHLIADDLKLIQTLLFLLAAADEAGRGLGVLSSSSTGRTGLMDIADELLRPTQFGSTLCMAISPSVARVLPKVHTAKPGLTIRSFSHYLSYCETDEVQPQWYFIPSAGGDVKNTFHLNLLVVPWPQKTRPEQIRAKDKSRKSETNRDPSPWGYFEYQPFDSGRNVAREVLRLCDEALRVTGSVDAVVMPELAVGVEDYQAVRDAVLRKGLILVTGVGSKEPSGQDENRLCVDVPLSPYHYVHLRQRKHHRWRLDRSQIEQYGLAARLDRSKWYWEDIELRDRKLMFLVLRPWLVSCAVICEDLARHDPVGELVRGVGPNLVIALLMDGPQIASRWPSRYASSLADDPGSSVLSVTSLGMSELSSASTGTSRSRVVALWRDSKMGTREIELPEEHSAVLLTLCSERDVEHSADNRTRGSEVSHSESDGPEVYGAYTTVLAGSHPIKTVPAQDEAKQDEEPMAPVVIGAREASVLAQLAQQKSLSSKSAPEHLKELEGDAFLIGHALWEAMVNWEEEKRKDSSINYRKFSEKFLVKEESHVRKTALAIQEWARTNWDVTLPIAE